MADPLAGLAVASSILAILQLTGTIISQGYSYIALLKDSPRELQDLFNELSSLSGILSALKGQLDHAKNTPNDPRLLALIHLDTPGGPLNTCQNILYRVQKRIHCLNNSLGGYLVVPRYVKETKYDIECLERLKSILQLALFADQMTLSQALGQYLRTTHDEFRNTTEEFRITNSELRKEQQVIRKRLRDIQDDVEILGSESKQRKLAGEAVSNSRNRDKILRLLFNTNHVSNHQAACSLRQHGTGSWFIEGEQFKQWRDTSGSLLWLYGIPGAGKTILTSTIVVNITTLHQGSDSTAAVYFYFDFNDSSKQTTAGMLSSCLFQLLDKLSAIPHEVHTIFKKYHYLQCPTECELLDLLGVVLGYFTRTFIILDALDESTERSTLLLAIGKLIKTRDLKNTSFLFTSRKEYDIDNEFSKHPVCRVCIQTDEVASDVKLYVIEHIEKDERLRKLQPGLKDHIMLTLATRAKGMFRWVKCQLDIIRETKTPKAIREALLSLPQGLDETYERILINVPQDAVLMRRALQLIVFAVRPVTLEEVAEAVIIEAGEVCMDKEARLHDPKLLLAICGSLVSFSGPHLGLAHYSVQEFLTSERIHLGPARQFAMTAANSAFNISEICLTYLGFHDFNTGPCASENFESRKQCYPFLAYAATSWFEHARVESVEQNIIGLATKLFSVDETQHFLSWRQAYNNGNTNAVKNATTPLCCAAQFGLHCVSRHLLEHGADTNARGISGLPALYYAVESGFESIVEMVLQYRADVNGADTAGYTPLALAARAGSQGMVGILLRCGADPNAKRKWGETALNLAVFGGFESIVEILLQHGADISDSDTTGCTPLAKATGAGSEGMVGLLLRRGADPNAKGMWGETALHRAVFGGFDGIVAILIQHGADPNAQARLGETVLHNAVVRGSETMVEMLIRHGADPNVEGQLGETALQNAVARGSKTIVKMLLQHEVDINGKSENQITALDNGSGEVLEVLLRYPGDRNPRCGDHRAALHRS